jgi:hypothetical protein
MEERSWLVSKIFEFVYSELAAMYIYTVGLRSLASRSY